MRNAWGRLGVVCWVCGVLEVGWPLRGVDFSLSRVRRIQLGVRFCSPITSKYFFTGQLL